MNKQVEGHIFMFTAKFFSGLNTNGLKYLIPLFISPLAGVTFRVFFGAIAFWIIDYFVRRYNAAERRNHSAKIDYSTRKSKQIDLTENNIKLGDILSLILIGAVGFYLFQITYLYSVKFTTPVSITILVSLLPVWTYLLGWLIFKTERRAWNKILGITISICAALLSIFSNRAPHLASHPILGDMLAIVSNIAYAVYLIYSKKLLKKFSSTALLKWSFTGAALSALVVDLFIWGSSLSSDGLFGLTLSPELLKVSIFSKTASTGLAAGGIDAATSIHWNALLVLLFILIFPTVLSFMLQQLGLKYLSATVVASYNNVMVVVTTATSLILGQDKFNIMQLISIILLFLGLYFVSLNSSRKKINIGTQEGEAVKETKNLQ